MDSIERTLSANQLDVGMYNGESELFVEKTTIRE